MDEVGRRAVEHHDVGIGAEHAFQGGGHGLGQCLESRDRARGEEQRDIGIAVGASIAPRAAAEQPGGDQARFVGIVHGAGQGISLRNIHVRDHKARSARSLSLARWADADPGEGAAPRWPAGASPRLSLDDLFLPPILRECCDQPVHVLLVVVEVRGDADALGLLRDVMLRASRNADDVLGVGERAERLAGAMRAAGREDADTDAREFVGEVAC